MIKAIQQVIVRKILAYYINCFITEIIDVFSSVMNEWMKADKQLKSQM